MDIIQAGAWYAAVDYLRLTWRKGSDNAHVYPTLYAAALVCGKKASRGVEKPEEQKLLGYKGYKVGKVFVGASEQGLLLQASGLAAQYVAESDIRPDNVSRIDIQETVWFPVPNPGVAAAASDASVLHRRRVRGRPYKVRFIDGKGDGDTCYIGARGKKAKFLRIYDKHAESGDSEYKNAWRFEAELTDYHANMAWGSLKDIGTGPEAISAMVGGYFDERGVKLPSVKNRVLIRPEALPIDEGSDERRLRWLSTQVKPAIDKLIANGVSLEQVLDALGVEASEAFRRSAKLRTKREEV